MRPGRRLAVGLAAAVVAATALGGPSASAGDGDGDAPDVVVGGPQGGVGQFIVACDWSHASFDDPIVHAGMEGMSHRHEFFGNTTTDADSTYESLLAGDTTCAQKLDRAAYWVPSLLDGEGRVVQPGGAVAYYRAGPGVDPTTVQPYPPGLMMVGGHSDATDSQPLSVVAWSCGPGGERSSEPPPCADGPAGLRLWVTFPDCWDGTRLDSDDHHAHVAYSHDGRCGDEHPVPIPQLQFAVDYPPTSGGPFALASGPIDTAHADFWNAWDEDKLVDEVDLCLHRDLVCGISHTDNRTF